MSRLLTGGQSAGGIRVLIADDDARVRTALRSFLSATPGFEVIGDAGDPDVVLELARQHAPAVVIVGVQMPTADEGLRMLRTVTSELRIPAVAISTRGRFRGQALAAGACQFVEKDSSPESLLAALRAAASPAGTLGHCRERRGIASERHT